MSISDLKARIFSYIFQVDPLNDNDINKIFKKHSQNLKDEGDLSFPSNYEVWLYKTSTKKDLDNNRIKKCAENLITESLNWTLPIEKVNLKNDKYILHLNKFIAMKYVFHEVLENPSYGKFKLEYNFRVMNKSNDCNENLTFWRNSLIASTIDNVIKFCTNESSINKDCLNVDFTSNGSNNKIIQNSVIIRCGIVINASTKKKTDQNYEDYFRRRRNDMKLMAMHKYGIRIHDNTYLREFLDKLGKAAVVIDLLEVKHTSPVQIGEGTQRTSKGASFILYNCARLETLLETFNERIKKQFYLELPILSKVDISNLKEDEEWQLVYNYILTFPDLVKRVIINLECGQCSPHLIPQFLNGLVSLFSVYYRKVKILVDNRVHLLKTLYARIYLLKCIQKIFKICLEFLHIKSIQKM